MLAIRACEASAASLMVSLAALGATVQAGGSVPEDKAGCNFGLTRAANRLNPFDGVTARF